MYGVLTASVEKDVSERIRTFEIGGSASDPAAY